MKISTDSVLKFRVCNPRFSPFHERMAVLKGEGAYRNSYLIHVGKLERIVVDVILGEGWGLWGWSTRRIRQRRRFLGITVPLVEIQALLAHILAPRLVDQLQHLRALFLHQRRGCRPGNWIKKGNFPKFPPICLIETCILDFTE